MDVLERTDALIESSLEHPSSALPQFVRFDQLGQDAQRVVVVQVLGEIAGPPAPSQTKPTSSEAAADDEAKWGPKRRWSETARLLLHFALLKELRRLRYGSTPLAVLLDLAQWVFGDDRDVSIPFSFARCVLVAQLYSQLYPTDEFDGLQGIELQEAQQMIRNRIIPMIERRLEELPAFARQWVCYRTRGVVRLLDRNPQWLNEKVRVDAQRVVQDPNLRLLP